MYTRAQQFVVFGSTAAVLLLAAFIGSAGAKPAEGKGWNSKSHPQWAAETTTTSTTSTTTTTPTSTTAPGSDPSNSDPVARITPPFEVAVGQMADVWSTTSSDPDGDPISWSWSLLSGPDVAVSADRSHLWFTPDEPGEYLVEVTVTDGRGGTDSKTTTVTASGSTTTSDSSGPSTSDVQGDSHTASAEQRLLDDPSVLWLGTYDNSGDWSQYWGVDMNAYPGNQSLVSWSPARYGNALRVFASGNNDGWTGFGMDLRSSFDGMQIGGQEEAYFRYYVYFPADWQPYEGGKLPGLSGISPGESAWTTSGGGDYHESSWSGRVMWRRPLDGDPDHARLSSYLYVRSAGGRSIYSNTNPSNGRIYGIQYDFKSNGSYLSPVRGAWNLIELHYAMNTPGQNNGVFEAWLNGTKGVSLHDVQYRTSAHPGLDINQMFFSSFYGGPTSNETDQVWYFDDVAIADSRLGG